MRRLVLVHLVCWARLAAPVAVAAQTATAARRPGSQPAADCADPAGACADPAGSGQTARVTRSLFEPDVAPVPVRRPVEQRRRRPGAIPALPGHPGRRPLHRCTVRARRSGGTTGCSAPRPTTSAGAISVTPPITNAPGGSSSPVSGTRSRSSTASTPKRRISPSAEPADPRRCDAAHDPERPGESVGVRARSRRSSISRSGATSATERPGHADAAARPQGGLHDARGTSGSCRGAPVSDSATTSKWRCRTTREPTTSRSAPSGRTAATCFASRTTAPGSTISTTRWYGTARCGLTIRPSAPGRGRMALWPSNSAQTVSAAGYTKFARRTQLTGFVSFGFWSNDEPLQPFTINATLPQLTLPRATTQSRGPASSRQT